MLDVEDAPSTLKIRGADFNVDCHDQFWNFDTIPCALRQVNHSCGGFAWAMPVACSPFWRPFVSSILQPGRDSRTLRRGYATASAVLWSESWSHGTRANLSKRPTRHLTTYFQARCASQSSLPRARQERPQIQNAAHRRPSNSPIIEQGVPLAKHRNALSRRETYQIFPRSNIDGKQALRLLQVLQGRRVDGTLDLALPPDLTKLTEKDQYLISSALDHLRRVYPLDEDSAILQRIQAEENEQVQGLRVSDNQFKPQSGDFGEQRGENNSIWGKSALEQIRRQNEDRAKLAREKDDRRIDELDQNLKKQGNPGGLVRVEDQDLSLGRPITTEDVKNNVYLRWKLKHSMDAMSEISESQSAQLSSLRRLLPSAIFTAAFLLAMYWLSEAWYEPRRIDRLWPDVPPAAATLFGLIIANSFIFALWRVWPPAWKYLNRYFISVPGYPYVWSMLGNTFSHQGVRHLIMNMAVLWLIGVRLHEDTGRGTFLAIYLASGVFGSLTSLTYHTLRGLLTTTSLGASASLTGIIGAYLVVNSE